MIVVEACELQAKIGRWHSRYVQEQVHHQGRRKKGHGSAGDETGHRQYPRCSCHRRSSIRCSCDVLVGDGFFSFGGDVDRDGGEESLLLLLLLGLSRAAWSPFLWLCAAPLPLGLPFAWFFPVALTETRIAPCKRLFVFNIDHRFNSIHSARSPRTYFAIFVVFEMAKVYTIVPWGCPRWK